ncbi:MAG: glycosyltransferase family 2 protein, partial [Vitreimonas sp.]
CEAAAATAVLAQAEAAAAAARTERALGGLEAANAQAQAAVANSIKFAAHADRMTAQAESLAVQLRAMEEERGSAQEELAVATASLGEMQHAVAQRDRLLEEARATIEANRAAQSAAQKASFKAPALREDALDLSIVVPCYNQGQFVADEVALLALEPELSFEMIVVDDGSTEARTRHALEKICGHPRINVIRQENSGLSAARNTGLLAARGKYVLFLDADDVLAPGLTERLKQADASDADVTVFDYLISNEYLTYFERPNPYTIASDLLTAEGFEYRWERGLTVPIHSAIFKRRAISHLFNTELAAKEDWVFWVSNFRAGMSVAYVPSLQAIYRQSGSNMTKNVGRMMESWIAAARYLGDQLDHNRTKFLEASMAHVRSYYVPVLQWQARHNIDARSRLERAVHRAWLYLESIRPQRPALRLAKGAVKHAIRGARSVWSSASARIGTARLSPAHLARRANFAIRRSTAKRGVGFSIVVPVYNHSEHLSRCFTSLTDQKYRATEIIAVDDCSPDPRVREIMDCYAHHNPELFKAVQNPRNLGICETLNRAVDMARGEWIVLVDCDDWLELGALKDVARAINGRDSIGYVFSDRRRIDEVNGRTVVERFGGRPDLLDQPFPYALRMSMVASHLKTIRRDLHFDLGGYDKSLDGVQDWDFALRAMNRGVQFSYIPRPIYNYRWHAKSVSLSAAVTQWRLANVVRQTSMFPMRPPAPSFEQVRAGLTHYSRVIIAAGQSHPIALSSVVAQNAQAVALRIGGVEDARWVERLRCGGYNGWVVGKLDAPYTAEFAGELRQVSGFFDQLVTSDPLWTIALAPVATNDRHVVFNREF